jgi:hypothetical protein
VTAEQESTSNDVELSQQEEEVNIVEIGVQETKNDAPEATDQQVEVNTVIGGLESTSNDPEASQQAEVNIAEIGEKIVVRQALKTCIFHFPSFN